MRKNLKKVTACLLTASMCMAAPSGAFAAPVGSQVYEEDKIKNKHVCVSEESAEVYTAVTDDYVGDIDDGQIDSISIDTDYISKNEDGVEYPALEIDATGPAENQKQTEFTVDNDVDIKITNDAATGIGSSVTAKGTFDTNVGGSVKAESTNDDAAGVTSSAKNDSKSSVTVGKDVAAISESGDATGIEQNANAENANSAETEVTVKGSVTVSAPDEAVGVKDNAKEGGKNTTTIGTKRESADEDDGGDDEDGEESSYAVSVTGKNAIGIESITDGGSENDITVNGDVNVFGVTGTGITAGASEDSGSGTLMPAGLPIITGGNDNDDDNEATERNKETITADGSVFTAGTGSAVGIEASGRNDTDIEISVKDVYVTAATVEPDTTPLARGIEAGGMSMLFGGAASGDTENTIKIEADNVTVISEGGPAYGVSAGRSGASGIGLAFLVIEPESCKTEITVNRDVTARGNVANGSIAMGDSTIKVAGNVTVTSESEDSPSAAVSNDSQATTSVVGDADASQTANGSGINIIANGEGTGRIEVLGKVSGSDAGSDINVYLVNADGEIPETIVYELEHGTTNVEASEILKQQVTRKKDQVNEVPDEIAADPSAAIANMTQNLDRLEADHQNGRIPELLYQIEKSEITSRIDLLNELKTKSKTELLEEYDKEIKTTVEKAEEDLDKKLFYIVKYNAVTVDEDEGEDPTLGTIDLVKFDGTKTGGLETRELVADKSEQYVAHAGDRIRVVIKTAKDSEETLNVDEVLRTWSETEETDTEIITRNYTKKQVGTRTITTSRVIDSVDFGDGIILDLVESDDGTETYELTVPKEGGVNIDLEALIRLVTSEDDSNLSEKVTVEEIRITKEPEPEPDGPRLYGGGLFLISAAGNRMYYAGYAL